MELDNRKTFNKWYKKSVKAGHLEEISAERLDRCYQLFLKYKYKEANVNETVNAAVIDILNKKTH